MYDAFWEAICVECLIKRDRLRKAKMQEEKSLQTTEVLVVEPLMENASSESEEKEPGSHIICRWNKRKQRMKKTLRSRII